MTTDDIIRAVECLIAHGDNDPESSHQNEDMIFIAALEIIGSGNTDIEDCIRIANLALRAREAKFPRWYA